jgi:CAAX prenyl protease-like protein
VKSGPFGLNPAVGYVLPFFAFIAILTVSHVLPVPQPLRFICIVALLAIFSRGLLPLRASRLTASVALGIAVFFVWVGPDLLFPGYRHSILFSNAIVGHPEGSTAAPEKIDWVFLAFRVLGSVITVPIIEELFWRGFLMRWIVDRKFLSVPMGLYHAEAFWLTAVLFASEHGSYWDVGLLAGAIYNWWAIRTRNLTDCVIAHATTNLCLAIYVIGWDQWQYWL